MTENENTPAETTEKKVFKAKTLSLIAKVLAALILIACLLLKAFTSCAIDINDACKVAFSIIGIFGTVDLNIMLDKVFKN